MKDSKGIRSSVSVTTDCCVTIGLGCEEPPLAQEKNKNNRKRKLRDLATPEFLKIPLSSNPKSKLALDKGVFG